MPLTQVTTGGITDGTITNADISASAAIDASKVSGLSTDSITEGNTTVEVVDTGSDGHITFDTEGGERMRITSDGRVGINELSPDTMLHVRNDNSAAAKFGGHGGSEYYMEIGQLGSSSSPGFNATGTTASMLFQVDGTERMRIMHTSGNVGIGTTSPDALLDISVTGAANGSTTDTLILNNDNSHNGDNLTTRIRFNRSGNSSSNVYTALDSVRTGTHNTDFVVSVNDGGTLNEEFRVQSTGGISFNGDTATANALDDYEEGTYTVSLTSGSGSITLNSSQDTFAYTKIGRLVYIQGFITVSSTSSASGSLSFNIPFNADLSMSEEADNGHMPIIVNGTSKDCDRFAVAYNNTTIMSVITTDSTTAASASVADLMTGTVNIIVSFNYLASS